MLNEWLADKNFLQMSAVGQTENRIAGSAMKGTGSPDAEWNRRCEGNLNRERVLTLSDVLPCPLVILEEGMPLDLIHAVAAKSNFPAGGVRKDTFSLIQRSYVRDFLTTPADAAITLNYI